MQAEVKSIKIHFKNIWFRKTYSTAVIDNRVPPIVKIYTTISTKTMIDLITFICGTQMQFLLDESISD